MSETVSETAGGRYWTAAIAAGLVAGVAMGVPLDLVMGMMPAIGALYGIDTSVVGWLSHLWHAAVFGAIFAGLIAWGELPERLDATPTGAVLGVGLGVLWGMILWMFAAGMLMPTWLNAVGVPAPDLPALDPTSGVGHFIYGLVLGGGFALLR